MRKAIQDLIQEGDDLLDNHLHEFYEDHVEDLFLKFITKAQLLFRKFTNDPLELVFAFNSLQLGNFDQGKLCEILTLLRKAECYFEIDSSEGFWPFLHPLVSKLAKDKFEQGNYADAVETVLKEINSIVKKHYKDKVGVEDDGATLMNRAFSVNNPVFIFDDLSTETGRNIQQGYM